MTHSRLRDRGAVPTAPPTFSETDSDKLPSNELIPPLRGLFDRATDWIQVGAPDGAIAYVNLAWQAGLGYTAAEVTALRLGDLVHPLDRPRLLNTLAVPPTQTLEQTLPFTLVSRAGQPIPATGYFSHHQTAQGTTELWILWQPQSDVATSGSPSAASAVPCLDSSLPDLRPPFPPGAAHRAGDAMGNGGGQRSIVSPTGDRGVSPSSDLTPDLSEILTPDFKSDVKSDLKLDLTSDLKWDLTQILAPNSEPNLMSNLAPDLTLDLSQKLVRDWVQNLQSDWVQNSTQDWGADTVALIQRKAQRIEAILLSTTAALQKSEARFRVLFEQAAVGLSYASMDGKLQLCNPKFCEILGYSHAELLTKTFAELTHPADLAADSTQLAALLRDERPMFSMEKRYIQKDGSVIWTHITVSLLRDEQGQPQYTMCVVEDIRARKHLEHDRRQAETARRQAEAQYGTLFEHAVEGIFRSSLAGQFISANPALARIYGYAAPAELLASVTDIAQQLYVNPQRRAEFQEIMQDHGMLNEFESQVYRQDGSVIWISENARTAYDAKGNPLYYEGFVQDISDRKRHEDERHLAQLSLMQREHYLETLVQIQQHLLATESNTPNFYPPILELLGQCSRASRVYAFENHFNAHGQLCMSQKAEWCAEGIFAAIADPFWHNQPYDQGGFQRWATRLAQGDSIHGNVADFPLSEQEVLRSLDVQSILILPLLVDGQFWGYIGFDSCLVPRTWEPSELNLLQATVNAISLALEHQHTERELRAANAEMQALFSAMDELIFVFDRQGRHLKVVVANPNLLYKPDCAREGKTFHDVFPQEIADTFLTHVQTVFDTQQTLTVEYSLEIEGQARWSHCSISLIDDDRVLWTVRDVTQRQLAEQALRESEERFRQIAETIDQVFCIKSADLSQVLYVSPAYEELWGQTCESLYLYPFSWMESVYPQDTSKVLAAVGRQLQGEAVQEEYRIVRPNGQLRWVSCRTFPIFAADGTLQRHIALKEDISDRKHAEANMLRSLQKEKELNELKSRFVSMISHEFRTPLTTIETAAELLEHYEWPAEEKQERYQQIHAAVHHMTQLLEDVLFIGKVEAGKLAFNPQELDLAEFCEGLMADLQLTTRGQHILTFSVHGQAKPAQFDPKLLRQILSNLLSNAVKYSAPGSTIQLKLFHQPTQVCLQVQDDGIGISPQDQAHLFEPFHRSANVDTIQGTGLGLSIVKRCVDLHSGTIQVVSQLQVGTTFTVTLPRVN